MDKQKEESHPHEQATLIYGMQRSGSNYIEQVLLQNFQNIHFHNDTYARSLPTHKHFRLYDLKSAIPDFRFFNSFTYKDFHEFREHVVKITGREINLFIVNIKNPYSWYLSYLKHARGNKFAFSRSALNSHFIIDYNLFYKKWLDFSREAPDKVVMLKYEDFLENFDSSIQSFQDRLGLSRTSDLFINPGKVPMSQKFTSDRASYYKNNKYLDLISDEDKAVMQHLLDEELLSEFNYQIAR